MSGSSELTPDSRVRPHVTCRACGAAGLHEYLPLGSQAPANALRRPDDPTPEFKAPLAITWCANCGLSQLDQVVDPAVLYTNYPFRAGLSTLWQEHCVALLASLVSPERKFLIDIGANDGALLQAADKRGWEVLGVDPCPVDTWVPMVTALWSSAVAREILEQHGPADVITATNVFGHIDDAKDFLVGVQTLLKPRGVAIIECPHIFPLLESVAFDTIYHEHLSYWSLRPLELLAESVGLKVIDVRMFTELHGGTMRYVLIPGDNKTHVQTSVTGLRILESAQFQEGIAPYQQFATKAREQIWQFGTTLLAHHRAGKTIWGYGANAKGAVLLQAAYIRPETLERVVDDTPGKWGFLMPGTGIPITDAHDLSPADVLVLLSWNNATELQAKARSRGFTGQFVLPHAQMVDA